ncbi:MAG: universal stress protein [Candidatus Bathyarchaeota archaeon]|nr:universal stress protein [Candidatus Termiticorpusculum sp.]
MQETKKLFSSETIKLILVPTDGSGHSARAAEYAMSIAKAHDAKILAAFVIDTIVIDQLSRVSPHVEEDLKKSGQNYANYIVNLAEKQGVTVESIITKGQPFEQILHLAKSKNVDLIVMGTTGRRSTDRILIGSVTQRVIEYSPCPVLVLR